MMIWHEKSSKDHDPIMIEDDGLCFLYYKDTLIGANVGKRALELISQTLFYYFA